MKRTECIRSTVAVRFRSPPSSASTQTLSPLGRLPELQHLWYRPLTLSGGGTITRGTDEGFPSNNLESFPRMGGGDALGLVGLSIGLRGPLPWCFPTFPRDRRRKTRSYHGCCARSKSPERLKSSKPQDPSNPSDPAPSDSGMSCSSKAVIQWSISLEIPTRTPVSLPFPPTADWVLFGLNAQPSQYRMAGTEARWADKALPRWDAVFEPSVILGSGLQSLAPPFEA